MCNVLIPDLKDELTAFQLHCTCLAVHGEVFQIHGTGKGQCQPGKQEQQHHNGTGMVCKKEKVIPSHAVLAGCPETPLC